MIDLRGKRALVTGGSRGIGAAIAEALAERGADVAFTYHRSVEKAAAVAKKNRSRGRRAVAIQADSADPNAIAQAVEKAVSVLGGLDILVNSAAIGHAGTIADLDVEEYQALMDINVRAPVPAFGGRRSYHHDRFRPWRAGTLSRNYALRHV